MELILFIWLPLCIAVAVLASRYNRSGFGWFLFSMLLSPLVGFIFVLALGPKAKVDNAVVSMAEVDINTKHSTIAGAVVLGFAALVLAAAIIAASG